MKTILALIVLSCPAIAGWTYPSLATLYQSPDPCFVPPGGMPPGMFYECPEGECPTDPGLASANQQYSIDCYANGATYASCIEDCNGAGGCEEQCDIDYYASQLVAKAQWQREVENSCMECE